MAEHPYERSVADGVNVGYEVYRVRTRVTEQGGKVECDVPGFQVPVRDKRTRLMRYESLDVRLEILDVLDICRLFHPDGANRPRSAVPDPSTGLHEMLLANGERALPVVASDPVRAKCIAIRPVLHHRVLARRL